MAPLCSVCAAGSNSIGCLEVEPGSGSAAPALPPLLGLIASPAVDAVPSEQRVHDIVLKQALAAAVPLTPLGPVRLAERKHVVGGLKVAFDHWAYDQAAIKFHGMEADINFTLDDYKDIKKDHCVEQLLAVLAVEGAAT